ncbi:hypothetical protein JOB18_009228 [Solea senegalensis]|uniref:Uncharacterized protein n=1 Tax=Solea senegalensis TaxID=28829 RepID=A0AAV6QFN5_SOLSE|nr:hypothetical protein JOB18_009228 [Solea senegalensis]
MKNECSTRKSGKSIQVEGLHPNVVKDMLELYFDKNWVLPISITMIPIEEAAIISFGDPKGFYCYIIDV